MAEWIRLILGTSFLLGGVIIAGIATFGIFRFKYVLNRMHAAALVDTLALLLCMIGLMFFSVDVFSSTSEIVFAILKMILVVVFLWFASPVASHLISKLEVTTNEELNKECEVKE